MPSGYFDAERATLEALFQGAFSATTYVAYENVPFAQPEASPWVRMTIRPGLGQSAALGGAFHRYAGAVIVQCFVPEETGTKPGRDLADAAAAVFLDASGRGKQVSTTNGYITFGTPYLEAAGAESGFLQLNVVVPYQRDQALT